MNPSACKHADAFDEYNLYQVSPRAIAEHSLKDAVSADQVMCRRCMVILAAAHKLDLNHDFLMRAEVLRRESEDER